MERIEKPLSISEILDLTFSIIRRYFKKLLLIMLILVGPVYLLQIIGMIVSGAAFFQDPNTTIGSLWDIAQGSGMEDPYAEMSTIESVFLIVSVILGFVTIPVGEASLMIAVDQIRKTDSVDVKTAIKQALSRFWALIGGTIVYGLVSIGLFLGLGLLIMLYAGLTFGIGFFLGEGGFPEGTGTGGIIILILGLVSFCAIVYLLTRWSFYFPAIVFEKVSPGLGKSWRLTRRNFWRLVVVYLVILVLTVILSSVLQVLPVLLLGDTILATLINTLVNLLLITISSVAFVIVYFDLRVRNEAADLKEILSSYNTLGIENINTNNMQNSTMDLPKETASNFESTTSSINNSPNTPDQDNREE